MIRPTVRDKLLPDALRQGLLQSVLVFALSAARVGGIYAPWALAAAAVSGGKSRGLWALLGAGVGALVFFDFQTGLRFAASAVLIYSANMAFCDTKMYARKGFAPLLAALALLLVQSVYLVGRSAAQWALGVSASAVAAAVACGLDESRENGRLHLLVVMTAAAAALSAVPGGGLLPRQHDGGVAGAAVRRGRAARQCGGAGCVCRYVRRSGGGNAGSSVGGGMRQRRIGGFPAAAKTPRAAGRRLLPVRGGGAAGAGRGQAVDGAVSGGGGGCGLRAGAEKVAGHPAGYGGAASGCAGHGGQKPPPESGRRPFATCITPCSAPAPQSGAKTRR